MLTRGVLEARLAVVTTDYDFQGLWLSSPFNHFFVARDETKAYMAAIGVPADRITVSGIPVRPGLGDPVDREAVLTPLRFAVGSADPADFGRRGRRRVHADDRATDAADAVTTSRPSSCAGATTS